MSDKVTTSVIGAAVGAVVSAFFLTVFQAQPQVPRSTGEKFFNSYYRQVTQTEYRKAIYQQDLTQDFRQSPGRNWNDYNAWWKTQEQVVVNKVDSVPGNPLQFTVWLTYYPKHGNSFKQATNFSLVCNGGWASFVARIPTLGCPLSHLEIQSGLDVRTAK